MVRQGAVWRAMVRSGRLRRGQVRQGKGANGAQSKFDVVRRGVVGSGKVRLCGVWHGRVR
jgi:hypothetical protein